LNISKKYEKILNYNIIKDVENLNRLHYNYKITY
ncbi:unnamed protein product, partial [marine sediment metagenome]